MPEIATDAGQQTSPQGTTPAQSGQTPGQQTTQQTSSQDAAGTATPTRYTYDEDRSRWIPPHRLNEVSQRYQTAEQKLKQYESDLAERDRKIAALAGVATPDQDAQREEQVREAFVKMFPQFKYFLDLSEEQMQQLTQLPQHVERTREQEQRQWQHFGVKQVGYISERVAESIGAEKLDAEQQDDLRVSFKEWLSTKAQSEIETVGQSKTLDRYEGGDQSLLDEFVQRYTKNWLTPAQRRTAAQTTQRTRPVVATAGRGQVTSIARPEKFASLDDRLDFAAKLAVERGLING